jgi:hypothetical protein
MRMNVIHPSPNGLQRLHPQLLNEDARYFYQEQVMVFPHPSGESFAVPQDRSSTRTLGRGTIDQYHSTRQCNQEDVDHRQAHDAQKALAKMQAAWY